MGLIMIGLSLWAPLIDHFTYNAFDLFVKILSGNSNLHPIEEEGYLCFNQNSTHSLKVQT